MSLKQVVGVSFEPGDSVPTVVLKGAGAQAQMLIDDARADGQVPVVADPKLVRELYRVPLDAPIGRELFPVMAALLAHVLHIDKSHIEKDAGDCTP